jgi:hypothetical protein
MRWSRSARPIAALVGAGLLVAARFAEGFGGGEHGWFADGRGWRAELAAGLAGGLQRRGFRAGGGGGRGQSTFSA